ncbi:hypothetical protein V8C86DRAFT_1130712 [Haematococcus lacustris]
MTMTRDLFLKFYPGVRRSLYLVQGACLLSLLTKYGTVVWAQVLGVLAAVCCSIAGTLGGKIGELLASISWGMFVLWRVLFYLSHRQLPPQLLMSFQHYSIVPAMLFLNIAQQLAPMAWLPAPVVAAIEVSSLQLLWSGLTAAGIHYPWVLQALLSLSMALAPSLLLNWARHYAKAALLVKKGIWRQESVSEEVHGCKGRCVAVSEAYVPPPAAVSSAAASLPSQNTELPAHRLQSVVASTSEAAPGLEAADNAEVASAQRGLTRRPAYSSLMPAQHLVLIKLVGAGPEQLAPDLAPRLQSLLGQDPSPAAEPPTAPLHRVRPSVASTAATTEAGAAPQRLLLAGLTVRRGCVELVLTLVSLPPDTERPGVGVEPRGGSSRPSSSADVIGGHLSQPGWWRSLLALLLQQPGQQAAASGPPAGRQPPQFVKAMVQVVSSSGTMRQQELEPGQPCTAWECSASAASGCCLDSAPAPELPGSCLSHHPNQGWGLAAWPQVIALTPGGQTGPPACCPPCHVPLPLTLHLTHPPPRAAAYSPLAAATADPPTEPTYTAGGALCWAPGSLPWGGGVQVKARCGRGPSCPLHASPRDHAPGQGAGGVAQGHAASQMQVVAMVPPALAAGGGLLLLELWVPAQQSSPPSSCPCHDPAPLLPPGPAPPAPGATPPTSPPPHLSLVLLNQVPVVVLPSSQAWWWWPGAGGGGPQPAPLGVSRAGALAGEAASQERVRAELAALLQQESSTGTTGGPCPAALPAATALILHDVTAATDPGAVRVDICCSTPDGSGPSALLADLGAWLDFAAQLADAGQPGVAGGAGRPGAAAEAGSAPASQIALPCPDLYTSHDNRVGQGCVPGVPASWAAISQQAVQQSLREPRYCQLMLGMAADLAGYAAEAGCSHLAHCLAHSQDVVRQWLQGQGWLGSNSAP